MAHAVLSPSAASRWMACTPSARLEQAVTDNGSDFAKEGTLAHAICEATLRSGGNDVTKKIINKVLKENPDIKEFYKPEMIGYCQDYVDYVLIRKYHKSVLFVEHQLDLTNFIEEGFGTMDAGIITPAIELPVGDYQIDLPGTYILETFDLKYGKGVAVFAEKNKQAMIYALGVLNDFGYIYNITHIRMHIVQPRTHNITEWDISVADLLEWAEAELRPKAELAFEGTGEFAVGDHCGFCKVKATCRAIYDHNMQLAALEFKQAPFLTQDEILDVIRMKPLFESWLESVQNHVYYSMIAGKSWPGYKLVEGRSVRKYSNEDTISAILEVSGFEDIYKPISLLPLGELEAAIGRENFNKIVGPLLIKPPGKPSLVPESNKKPIFNSTVTEFQNLDE